MLSYATGVLAETNPDTGAPFFPGWVWAVTIGAVLALMAVDLFVVDHNPHEVSTKEAARWVTFYVVLAVIFGLGLWYFVDGRHSIEFFSGYILEYSLSVDNLFVFVLIMSSFAVPKKHQHRVLLIGILIALILRTIFIVLGAAVISRFQPVFFLFGAFLLYTAWKLATEDNDEDEEYQESKLIRMVRKVYPVTDDFQGAKTSVKIDGKRWLTPMFIVMLAIGSTDLLFALDSIPAIFGVTKEPFIVFTANAFALMGLRQLYFLIGGLLDKLVYLSKGLSIILGFIGLKLIYEAAAALHWLPHIETQTLTIVSLGFIVVVLTITTVLSLRKTRRDDEKRDTEGSDAISKYDGDPQTP